MKHLIACTLVIFVLALVPALAKKALSVDSEITHFTDEQAEELFRDFIAYHAKNYESEEEAAHRLQVFRDNLHYIAKHNREAAKGKHTYTLGLNPLADLSFEEYKEQYLSGFNATIGDDDDDDDDHFRVDELPEAVNVPTSIDWRTLGHIGPVLDQGSCGSCWAFSTISMIEGAWSQAGRGLLNLSEQQLVDCVAGGSFICSRGGDMRRAAADVITRGGVQSESSYPYCTCSGRGCRFNRAAVVASIRSYAVVNATEDGLLNAAAVQASVSVGMDASTRDFQLYRSGTFTGACKPLLNHAVNVVGYTPDYWIVRNSWGRKWGASGYIHMARGLNICGINNYATVVNV